MKITGISHSGFLTSSSLPIRTASESLSGVTGILTEKRKSAVIRLIPPPVTVCGLAYISRSICTRSADKSLRQFCFSLKKTQDRYSAALCLKDLFQINYRSTRALPPPTSFSTSFKVAILVSPGVVIANAPCAAPKFTATSGSSFSMSP